MGEAGKSDHREVISREYPRFEVALGLISGLLFGIAAACVKLCPPKYSAFDLMVLQGGLGTLLVTPFAFKDLAFSIRRGALPLWIRAFGGAGSVACLLTNLSVLSVGDAYTLSNLATVVVVVLAYFSSRKRFSIRDAFGLLICVGGSLMLHPASGFSIPSAAIVTGLIGAVSGGIAFFALKSASTRFGGFLVVWCFSIACVSVGSVFAHDVFTTGAWTDLQGPILVAAFTVLGQLALTSAMAKLSTSLASTLSISSAVWGVAIQSIFMGSVPRVMSIVSYALVLGGVYLLQTERRVWKPADSSQKAIKSRPRANSCNASTEVSIDSSNVA